MIISFVKWFFSSPEFDRNDYEIIKAESGRYILIGPGQGRMTITRFDTMEELNKYLDENTK